MSDLRRTLAAARAALPDGDGSRWHEALRHGSLRVGLYAPRGHDPQQPHSQDEVYIVMAGSGTFDRAGERVEFGPGDVLFVPAGVCHRFEEFTDDLTVWVVFYGPEGGEADEVRKSSLSTDAEARQSQS